MKRWRVAYLVTHPIQYQAPLLRQIAQQPDIELNVFFCSDLSVSSYTDKEFGRRIAWDTPLTDGYPHVFLPAIGRNKPLTFFRPVSRGLGEYLRKGRFDALWVHGWGQISLIWSIQLAHHLGVKVLLRGETGLHLREQGWPKHIIKDRFLRWLFAHIDSFLAIGTMNRDFYLSRGIDQGKIFMMPYAVDNRFFQKQASIASREREQLRLSLGLEPGRPIILYASKLTERKRPFDLLEAYVQLSPDRRTEPHPYLIFIGEGKLRPGLEQRVRALGWNSVHFLGFKNQSELPSYYDLCDVFVLPSVNEPWGLVINEVMNAGRAIIVSNEVGCAWDLLRNGENGYQYRAGVVEDLQHAIRSVIERTGECTEMGRKSLEIINHWSIKEDINGLRQSLMAITGV